MSPPRLTFMTRAINRRLLAAITLGCLACSAQGATSNA
ncbi:MAG: hypothetical protein ACI8QC_004461, partial [Planctomycetota bacterium]